MDLSTIFYPCSLSQIKNKVEMKGIFGFQIFDILRI